MTRRKPIRIAALIAASLLAGPAFAQSSSDDDAWQYRLTPYLWLPTIEGGLKYQVPPGGGGGTGAPDISVGPADWFDLLNYGLLLGGSAQKGRFSLFGDVVILSLTSEKDRVASVEDTVTIPGTRIPVPVSADLNLDTETDMDGVLWTLTAGYAVSQTDNSTVSIFAGARTFDIDAATRWDLSAEVTVPGTGVILPAEGRIKAGKTITDVVAGVRGELGMGQGKWSVPFYVDYGGGDSDKTWNVFVGLAREYGWGDLLLAYRHLEVDQDDDSLLQDFSFGGPAIGARFSF